MVYQNVNQSERIERYLKRKSLGKSPDREDMEAISDIVREWEMIGGRLNAIEKRIKRETEIQRKYCYDLLKAIGLDKLHVIKRYKKKIPFTTLMWVKGILRDFDSSKKKAPMMSGQKKPLEHHSKNSV